MRWLLYPLSLLYGLIVSIRNLLFEIKVLPSHEFDIPVISVGNITVGGTGKTPHIEYLVRLLESKYNLATLSRGYKRKTSKFIIATKQSTSEEIGDEPKQIKQKFSGITVAVDKSRVNGIKKLQNKIENLDLILLDDAYQHRYVKPGLSILLVDYNRMIYNDHMLPYGNLREDRHQTRRANIIIVTKTPTELKPITKRIIATDLQVYPYQELYFTSIEYGEIKPVFKSNKFKITLEEIKNGNYSVLLVTGIANPAAMYEYVKKNSEEVIHLKFSDHHKYNKADFIKINKTYEKINNSKIIILTTEKDAIRFADYKNPDEIIKTQLYYLPIQIEFDSGKENFDNKIFDYVNKNKRNRGIHKK